MCLQKCANCKTLPLSNYSLCDAELWVHRRWIRIGDLGLSLVASCEHLRPHLGPVFPAALWNDSSGGVSNLFIESVIYSSSNTHHVCPSTWTGSAPPSEVEMVLSTPLLKRHMLSEWPPWAPPAVMVSIPFTDKPAGNNPLSHYFRGRRKGLPSFLSFLSPCSPPPLFSFLILSFLPTLLAFFSFFLWLSFSSVYSHFLLLTLLVQSLIGSNWLHE